MARVLRRDCEPEIMPILLAPFGEGLRVGVVGSRIEHPGGAGEDPELLRLMIGRAAKLQPPLSSGRKQGFDRPGAVLEPCAAEFLRVGSYCGQRAVS